MFLTFTKDFKTGFENRKWNYPIRKYIISPTSSPLQSKNFYFKMLPSEVQVNSNWIGRRWYYFNNFPTNPVKVPIADSKQL